MDERLTSYLAATRTHPFRYPKLATRFRKSSEYAAMAAPAGEVPRLAYSVRVQNALSSFPPVCDGPAWS